MMSVAVKDLIEDAKVFLALSEGDEGVIRFLDSELEDWLYRKSECPNCGTGSEPVEK